MKQVILLILVLFYFESQAQINTSFQQQTNNTLFSVGYEYTRFMGELRMGYKYSGLVVSYKFLEREEYFMEAGVGYTISSSYRRFGGLEIPLSLHVFPFEKKQFGFLAELAIINDTEKGLFDRHTWQKSSRYSNTIRAGWGIFFRFKEPK